VLRHLIYLSLYIVYNHLQNVSLHQMNKFTSLYAWHLVEICVTDEYAFTPTCMQGSPMSLPEYVNSDLQTAILSVLLLNNNSISILPPSIGRFTALRDLDLRYRDIFNGQALEASVIVLPLPMFFCILKIHHTFLDIGIVGPYLKSYFKHHTLFTF